MTNPVNDMSDKELKASLVEYQDISACHRNYSSHHVAMLTVLIAITGVTFKYAFDGTISGDLRTILKCFGFLVGSVFFVQGSIYLYRQARFEKRLVELEKTLGYRHYSGLIETKRTWFRPGRISIYTLYFAITIFWLWALFIKK